MRFENRTYVYDVDQIGDVDHMRTDYCGKISKGLVGQEVVVCGWVRRRRDHGGLIFMDVADYTGCIQVVFVPESGAVFQRAEELRSEYVVKVKGRVRPRPDGTSNQALKTGGVEIEAYDLEIFSKAKTPPFVIQNVADAKEELRLKFRYLDMRREPVQAILRLRHNVCRHVRAYLDGNGFCDVETPILTKPTPEGARDFLVPSRLSPGSFYALPQSPQLFKQILMCAGVDRYYQIVRCFRDEDFRANRQPEFTQIDMEMSFIEEEDVIRLIEGLMSVIWRETKGVELPLPFPRMTYAEAVSRFGTDAPDMRFGLELVDFTQILSGSEFQVFSTALAAGGVIKGLVLPGGADLSRKQIDELTEFVKQLGAKGLVWFKCEGVSLQSPSAKHLTQEQKDSLLQASSAGDGDILLILADSSAVVSGALAQLRIHLAKQRKMFDENALAFLWVTRFPLMEWDQGASRYVSVHHPFTAPYLETPEDMAALVSDPTKLTARAYDLVLNGQEIAGGSIRIHDQEVQREIFRSLGISEQEAESKFGFLLEALSYGAPPHGGIAVGLDRLVMILAGQESIREVIPFPKTSRGTDLMVDAPAPSDVQHLLELGLRLK